MITENLSGVVCGNSDILLDQLIQKGVHFDLILTDPPYNINKDFGNQSDCLPLDEFIKITSERMAKVKKITCSLWQCHLVRHSRLYWLRPSCDVQCRLILSPNEYLAL